MPQQFVVPQFIDTEAKLLGPITARQFLTLIVGLLVGAAAYRIFIRSVPLVIIAEILIVSITIVFAFAKVNGQPFHYILLNMIQTFRKPRLRVWDKRVSDSDIKRSMQSPPEAPQLVIPLKKPLSSSRLSELSLVVNTGGAYKPEQEITDLID